MYNEWPNYSREAFNSTQESCEQKSSDLSGLKTYFCEKSKMCHLHHKSIDIECDGIIHCPHGEDEDFVKCKAKKSFPKSAIIECQNKYFPNVTILATRCNNVTECSNESDERYCGLDEEISRYFVPFSLCSFVALCLILIIVIAIYANKSNLLAYIFISDFVLDGSQNGIKGDDLANLKVTDLSDLI